MSAQVLRQSVIKNPVMFPFLLLLFWRHHPVVSFYCLCQWMCVCVCVCVCVSVWFYLFLLAEKIAARNTEVICPSSLSSWLIQKCRTGVRIIWIRLQSIRFQFLLFNFNGQLHLINISDRQMLSPLLPSRRLSHQAPINRRMKQLLRYFVYTGRIMRHAITAVRRFATAVVLRCWKKNERKWVNQQLFIAIASGSATEDGHGTRRRWVIQLLPDAPLGNS